MFFNYSKKRNRGFTLFELIVAIAVVALMFGIVLTQSNDWFDLNVKTATNKLSNTIRYLHDKAATQNLYIRLIFDFEKNNYWVEATSEQFLLTTEEAREAEELEKQKEKKEREKGKKEEGEVKEETAKEGEGGGTATEAATEVEKYRTPEFGAVDDFLLRPVKLPEGIYIKDVYTAHDDGAVSAGQAYIHFFPNGYVEHAIINLRNEADDVNYSVEINPLTGATSLKDEYRTMK